MTAGIPTRKILIVDDDPAIVAFLAAKLGGRYTIVSTLDPYEAVPLARRERPDLILCDVDMPDVDGGDVSAAFFADEETRGIPLAYLTAMATPEKLGELGGMLGGRIAISKHAEPAELVRRIDALVGNAPPAANMRIRVIRPASRHNIDPELMARSRALTQRRAPPGVELETVFLDSNPHSGPMRGNANEAQILSSVPQVLAEIVRAEREGWNAVFLTGEYDVGAEVARHLVRIPVVDIGTVTARFAPLLGDRVAILVIEDSVKPYARKLLRRWGVDAPIVSMQAWNIPLAEAWTRRDEVKARTLEICRRAMHEDEAEVILPFCAVFMPFLVAPQEIEAEIGIPVLDTVAIGLATTEMFVRLGIRASPRTYPPTPPAVWGL